MQKLWLKIVADKSNPLHWPMLFLLWIFSLVYRIGLVVTSFFAHASVKTSAPVISVGNLTVGGSGKTPMTIEMAKHFLQKHFRICIVSSGYGRKNKTALAGKGCDLMKASINDTGDEVMMMAEILPDAFFSVAGRKSEAAHSGEIGYNPDLIIVDDGFQHRRLHRSLDILLLDASIDIRKESLFPLGRRREPVGAIDRADAIILSKVNAASSSNDFRRWINEKYPGKVIAEAEYINENVVSSEGRLSIGEIAARKIYFFAGIGSFESLILQLRSRFPNMTGFRQFPDHCRYSVSELSLIRRDIERLAPEYVITTYKDFVKVRSFDFGRTLYYLDLQIKFVSGENALLMMLDRVASK